MSERPSTDGKLLGGTPTEPVPFGKYALSGLIARGGDEASLRARGVTLSVSPDTNHILDRKSVV